MLKRLSIYAREMYPIIPRLGISFLMVAVQILGVLAFARTQPRYQFNWEDLGIIYTVFAFLFLPGNLICLGEILQGYESTRQS